MQAGKNSIHGTCGILKCRVFFIHDLLNYAGAFGSMSGCFRGCTTWGVWIPDLANY